jgi:adenylosuccinate lyase
MIGMMVKVKEVKTRSELEKIISEQEIQIAEQEKNIEFLEMENERVKKALTDALVRYYILFCGFVTF